MLRIATPNTNGIGGIEGVAGRVAVGFVERFVIVIVGNGANGDDDDVINVSSQLNVLITALERRFVPAVVTLNSSAIAMIAEGLSSLALFEYSSMLTCFLPPLVVMKMPVASQVTSESLAHMLREDRMFT